MEKNEILDNLSGQVIKEMIKSKKIKIEELSARALDVLFDYESELVCSGERDDELLRQIAELLDPVDQTDETEQGYRDLIRNTLAPRTTRGTPAGRRRTRLRKLLIIAATFLVLVIGVSAIAEALGFGVVAYIRELMGMSEGSSLKKGPITLVRLDESKEYTSIEELLRSEDIDILYPTVLPEEVAIESVYISDVKNGGESISIFTDSVYTSFFVDTNVGAPTNEYLDREKYGVGEREYYLFEDASGYYAVHYDKNNFYTIRSTSRENIILIIENMKEFGQ